MLGIDVGKALGWTSNVVILSRYSWKIARLGRYRWYLQITASIESQVARCLVCNVHVADAMILRGLLAEKEKVVEVC